MVIRNEANRVEIDIIGKLIGESWFEEGASAESIANKIKDASEIVINLNSLGGDVNDALVIYDLLRLHKAPVTVNMFGMNASAATVVAMAGDNIRISENGTFLIHNVWTFTEGNADELRQQADELEKFDEILAKIYAKKTGKRKDSIFNLMKEEKWLTAEEAKEWGFVDKIVKTNHKNAYTHNMLLNMPDFDGLKEKILARLKPEYMKDTMLNSVLNVEQFEMQDGGIFLNKEQIDVLNSKLKELETAKAEMEEKHKSELTELQNKVSAVETEKKEMETKIAELQAELDKLNQKPSEPPVESDPVDEPKKNEEIAKFLAQHPDIQMKLKTNKK